MSVHKRWELQKALTAHLTAALANEGLPDADGDPTGIPVETDVLETNPQLFVRLDGFTVLQGAGGSAGHIDRHTFMAHVFCADTADSSDDIVDGEEEVARVQSLVVGALEDWEPLEGASGIEHISSSDAPDDDPATQHGVSRFKVMIKGGR